MLVDMFMYVYEKLFLFKQICQFVYVCLQKDIDCFFCFSRYVLLYMYMYVNEKIRNVFLILFWQICQVVYMYVFVYGQVRSFFYVGRYVRLVFLLQKLRGILNFEIFLFLCKGVSYFVFYQIECVYNQMDKVREQVFVIYICMCKWSYIFM